MERWQETGTTNCTAATALSREPSTENIRHLRLLAKHGVCFSHHDEHGHSVLDYAILGNNEHMISVAVEGLRKEFSQPDRTGHVLDGSRVEERITNLLLEAQRQNKHRQTFQLTFRLILDNFSRVRWVSHLPYRPISDWTLTRSWLRSALRVVSLPLGLSDDELYLKRHVDSLRQGYLRQRETISETRSMFDRPVMLRYRDLKTKMTRLPRPHSEDDMQDTLHFRWQYSSLRGDTDIEHRDEEPEFLIFLSYRWLGNGSPDDERDTQYQRMLDALELYLSMHPWLDQDQVSVWLDVACIDQVNPEVKQCGINALPLVVAQCNALISIADSEYLSKHGALSKC